MGGVAERPVSDVMFWGLAVRMVIASGHVERCQAHAISNRVEYQGVPFFLGKSPPTPPLPPPHLHFPL